MTVLRLSARHTSGKQLVANFSESGGTIGRSPDASLSLPDEQRTIGRLQGQVTHEDGQFIFTERGANPSFFNGAPLAQGMRRVLVDGDVLIFGPYRVLVAVSDMVTPQSLSASERSLGGAETPQVLNALAAEADPQPEPLADPLADIAEKVVVRPTNIPPPRSRAPVPAAPEGDEFDDFFDDAGPATVVPEAPSNENIEFDFDLSTGAHPSAELIAQQEAVDSVRAGTGETPVVAALKPATDTHRIRAAFGALKAAQGAESTGDQRKITEVLATVSLKAVAPEALSHNATQPIFIRTGGHSPPEREETDEVAPQRPSFGGSATPRPVAVQPAAATLLASSSQSGPTPEADFEDLLIAFKRGLGTEPAGLDAVSPALMERLGLIVRDTTEVMMSLLQSRAEARRETNADLTVMTARNNNPLKFCPDAVSAVRYLLTEYPNKAFMGPRAALRDAHGDLVSHQVGVKVGMNAALASVMNRFEPDALEAELSKKGLMQSLIPAARKSKLWDVYTESYRELADKASGEFEAVYTQAFLEAYEEEVARLKALAQQ